MDATRATLSRLIDHVYRGDAAATRLFIREFHPVLRGFARRQLRKHDLRPSVDSDEICQLTWLGFWRGVAEGQIEVSTVEDVRKILFGIVRTKVLEECRRYRTQRRDSRRVVRDLEALLRVASKEPDPEARAEARDEAARLLKMLPDKDRVIVEGRMAGRSLTGIADDLAMTETAVRRRFARAIKALRERAAPPE